MEFVTRRASVSTADLGQPALPPMVAAPGDGPSRQLKPIVIRTMRQRYAIRWSRLSELVALSASALAIAAALTGLV